MKTQASSPEKTSLVIDVVQMRPACTLIQAVASGDSATLYRHFDSEDWLVYPTPDMRLIRATPKQWAMFAKKYSVRGKVKTRGKRCSERTDA